MKQLTNMKQPTDTLGQSQSGDNENIRAAKEILRRRMRALRTSMGAPQRAAASTAICARLLDLLAQWRLYQPLSSVAVYLAKTDEACIDAVAEALIQQGVLVVAPRGSIGVGYDGAPFYALHSVRDGVHIGKFNVREPLEYEGGRAYNSGAMQIILTPGLAFDRSGGRLGFGGGWYDQVLQEAAWSATVSIGVCFACQLVEEVPCEEHDQRVSAIMTETQTIDADGRLGLKLKSQEW